MTPAALRTWRKRRGLTQADAAAAVRVSRSTWNAWETDGRAVPAYVPLALAAIEAGISMSYNGEKIVIGTGDDT